MRKTPRSPSSRRYFSNKKPVRWNVIMVNPGGMSKIIAHAVTEKQMDTYFRQRNVFAVGAHPRR